MTVKISGTFPKDLLAFNGLEVYREAIVETELSSDEEENWTGYAIARLSVKQTAKLAGGEYVPTVQIDHIEVMEGARVGAARRMLLDTFRDRTTDGVVDPVGSNGSSLLRHGSGLAVSPRRDDPDFDPYDSPDESPEQHHGRPVERVELPNGDYDPADPRFNGDPDVQP